MQQAHHEYADTAIRGCFPILGGTFSSALAPAMLTNLLSPVSKAPGVGTVAGKSACAFLLTAFFREASTSPLGRTGSSPRSWGLLPDSGSWEVLLTSPNQDTFALFNTE